MTEELVVSTGAQPGTYDAMATAKPDEPVFTLQGGDPFAAPAVLHWASLARQAGIQEERPEASRRLLRKASDAEVVAWAMNDYHLGRTDPVAENEQEEAGEHRPRQEAEAVPTDRTAFLTRAAQRLYNSISELTDLIPELEQVGENEAADDVREAVSRMRAAAGAVEPRRMMREPLRG